MNFKVELNRKPCCLLFRVKTQRQARIRIKVCNATKPNTFYQDRHRIISGDGLFYVRMPQSPDVADITIYNEHNGLAQNDNSFSVETVVQNGRSQPYQLLPLKTKLNAFNFKNQKVLEFVRFSQWFSEGAGVLSNGTYCSEYGVYRINYVDVIMSDDGTKISNSPARINGKNGTIDVASRYFKKHTVAGRMVILLHEFSHVFANKNAFNESEADLNALLIYLGLGYPRIEATGVFIAIFNNSDTPENRKRLKVLNKMIENFEKIPMVFSNYYYEGEQ